MQRHYLSDSELTSEAMACRVLIATGMPPPIRKNKEPSTAGRIRGTSLAPSIKGAQANAVMVPAYESIKVGLRPMLVTRSAADCASCNFNSPSLDVPIRQDAVRERRNETNDGVDGGRHTAEVGQLALDALDLA